MTVLQLLSLFFCVHLRQLEGPWPKWVQLMITMTASLSRESVSVMRAGPHVHILLHSLRIGGEGLAVYVL